MLRIATILAIIFATIFMNGCEQPKDWPKKKFDSVGWKQSLEKDRYLFVNDLIDSRLLAGLKKDQVIILLGTPSSESKEGIVYVVKLGGSGFDQVYLLDIRFDPVSRAVAKYFIRGD